MNDAFSTLLGQITGVALSWILLLFSDLIIISIVLLVVYYSVIAIKYLIKKYL